MTIGSDFLDAILAFEKKATEQIISKPVEIAKYTFTQIVQLSPYRTGRFIGNWQIGSELTTFSTLEKDDRNGNKVLSKINSTLTKDYFLTHDKIYMFNNVDYSRNVEYIGWANTQPYAPVGRALITTAAQFY